jgi:alpha-mannosidase
MVFPTRYSAVNGRFGIPYGSVLRSQVPNGMVSEAMWEVPFSRSMAVFDEGEREGLFLVTEAKYGACVRDGEIGLSLVRSPRVTGMETHGHAWPKHLSRLKNLSTYSDMGKHRIHLALGRYDIDLPREQQPAAVAETLFTPPLAYQGKAVPSPISSISGGETLLPSWAMPVDGKSWVLRFNEVAGRRGKARIKAAPGWKIAVSDIHGKATAKAAPSLTLPYTPYRILSLRFTKA